MALSYIQFTNLQQKGKKLSNVSLRWITKQLVNQITGETWFHWFSLTEETDKNKGLKINMQKGEFCRAIKSIEEKKSMWKIVSIKKNVVWLSMIKSNWHKEVTFSHHLMEKLNEKKKKITHKKNDEVQCLQHYVHILTYKMCQSSSCLSTLSSHSLPCFWCWSWTLRSTFLLC